MCHMLYVANDRRQGDTDMAKDTVKYTFHLAIDDNGKVGLGEDSADAYERCFEDGEGTCIEMFTLTLDVPKARPKKVHLGVITRSDDGAGITVESVTEAA
jgi:hypothetical protein